ncbi:MAG: MerC family mercury resistance protein [Candidatus Methylomirabilales bacterium]
MTQVGAPPEAPPKVSLRLLGGFSISLEDRLIGQKGWRLRKARTLVKLLALAPDRRLHREEIAALVWPDLDPKAAANNFYQALHCARKVIDPPNGPSHLRFADEILTLDGGVWTDVQGFTAAAAHAKSLRSVEAYRAAIAFYGGDLLPEDPYEEWALRRREQLRDSYLSLLFDLARLYEDRGEVAAAIEVLHALLGGDATNERAHSGLMRLYALSGDRAKALRQYEALRQVLRRELDVEPDSESQRLFAEIAAGRFPRQPAEAMPEAVTAAGPAEERRREAPTNLPEQGTTFVGRSVEVMRIGTMLNTRRLITLAGAPGCGKTRLAQEVGRAAISRFPDGTWLVDLAPVADPHLVPQTIAATLGASEQPGRSQADALVDHLKGRSLLLILDNCEHVLSASADLVSRLLQRSPSIQVIVTSREPLSIPEEETYEVRPLSLPEESATFPEGLARSEAVQLFTDRARAVRHSFRLTPDNAPAVAQICHRLDGIPLALELAASQLRALSAEQIAMRMEHALAFRSRHEGIPLRHQTLRAALDWSHTLLGETEQMVFRRLGVFPGSFSLDAVEAVAGEDGVAAPAVLPALTRLLRASLVTAEPWSREVRYRLLETVRQYALEQLREAGEVETASARLVDWCVQLAERAEPGLGGPEHSLWMERLEAEYDTFRAALEFCRDRDKPAGRRLAGALWQFWEGRGYFSEGRTWSENMLDRSAAPAVDPASARALLGAGTLAGRQGDLEAARRLLEESLRLFRQAEDRWGIGWALDNLGMLALSAGEVERARTMLQESLEIFTHLGDRRGAACTLDNLGWTALLERDVAGARRHFEGALAIFQEIGDRRGMGRALGNLANLLRTQGDIRQARALFKESAQFCQFPAGGPGRAAGGSFRALLLRLPLVSWSSFSGVATVPCAGVCAGYPLLAGLGLSFSFGVPLWAIVVHLILLPAVIPLNAVLLFVNFRRHRQPFGLAAGIIGGLLTFAALASHFEILSERAHDLIWPGGALLVVGVALDWIAQRRRPRAASARPGR